MNNENFLSLLLKVFILLLFIFFCFKYPKEKQEKLSFCIIFPFFAFPLRSPSHLVVVHSFFIYFHRFSVFSVLRITFILDILTFIHHKSNIIYVFVFFYIWMNVRYISFSVCVCLCVTILIIIIMVDICRCLSLSFSVLNIDDEPSSLYICVFDNREITHNILLIP